MLYPRIRDGAIVRSRKNTSYPQDSDFLAISPAGRKFHLSEQLADLFRILDGTLSMEEIDRRQGYPCIDLFDKLCAYDLMGYQDKPVPNENHGMQFREITDLKIACQTAVWHTTRKCNLKCAHCYYLYAREPKEDFSLAEIEAICQSLSDLGCEMVILSGGEILSNKKTFRAITDRLTNLCLPFRINTNGTLHPGEIIEVARKSKYFRQVQVSLDGGEAIHDALRGVKGSYQKTLDALSLFKQNGIRVRVVSMLTDGWLQASDGLEFARTLSDMKVDQWFIEIPSVTGRWDTTLEATYIPVVTDFSKKLIHFCEGGDHQLKNVIFNQVFNYPSKSYVSKSLEDAICSHDIGLISFGAEGVSYCTLFREQFGSDWKDFEDPTQLTKAWDKICTFRLSRRLKDNPTCRTCELFDICQGGCPGQYSDSKNFQGCDYHSRMLALVKKNLIKDGYGGTQISIN